MSASPTLRPSSQTPPSSPSPVAYNSAEAGVSSGKTVSMTENWKQWEGKVVNGEFPLRLYLGGNEHSVVFVTERRAGPTPQKAAIKLIPADPRTAETQLALWEQASKLSHPNLLKIYHFGRCELGYSRLLYVVTEFAEENLSQVLPERALTSGEVQAMMQPVLGALTYLHGKNLVHGHLKPSNIMAVSDQLRLSSDGLCASGGPRATSHISPYDAPEMIKGAPTSAADIWSLGMTIVEALTQRLPAWEAQTQREPVISGSVPMPFLDIAHKSLRMDPVQRATIADIKARLQSLPAPQKQKPASVQAAPSKPRYVVAGVVAVLVILAVLVGAKLRSPRDESRAAQPAPAAEVKQPLPESKPTPVVAAPVPVASEPAPEVQKPAPERPAPRQEAPKQETKVSPPPPAPAIVKTEAVTEAVPVEAPPPEGVLHEVLPNVPQSARRTISGHVKVKVRVDVDAAGNVTGSTLDSAGPSQYFARLAQQSAEQWKFAPAGAPSTWQLSYSFGRKGTDVKPKRAKP